MSSRVVRPNLGPRMSKLVGGAEAFVADMGVDLRRAEHLLNAAQICTTFEQVCRRSVPKPVRAEVRTAVDGAKPLVNHSTHGAWVDAAPPDADKHRRARFCRRHGRSP